MNFKPTKKKIIYSFVITLIWYLFLVVTNPPLTCSCLPGGFENCVDYEYLSPFQGGCHCSCTSLSTVIYEYFIAFIIPFLFIYFLISLSEE